METKKRITYRTRTAFEYYALKELKKSYEQVEMLELAVLLATMVALIVSITLFVVTAY